MQVLSRHLLNSGSFVVSVICQCKEWVPLWLAVLLTASWNLPGDGVDRRSKSQAKLAGFE
jgi:hypothetical protein